MILIPGLASHGDTWIPTAEHFATSHESHVLTLAGFVGVPAIGRPFLETVRADLARYIRDEELEKPIVIGQPSRPSSGRATGCGSRRKVVSDDGDGCFPQA